MRILRKERLYTEDELGELEQREYGLLRRVKATVGRARRNVAKKLEEKIDKNLVECGDAVVKGRDFLAQKAPKGSYKVQNQIMKEVRREQPNVQFTNKWTRNFGSGPYYMNRANPVAEPYFKDLKIPKYADHVIYTGKQPHIGMTLHEVGHMRRAAGKEGAVANFVSKKAMPTTESDPFDQISRSYGNGKFFKKTDAINRGVNVKDTANYISRWLEERGANKYADKELKRLFKEGKITEEMYNKGREATKVSMGTYTPATKVNILSSLKNTIDIPSRRGRFDLNSFK